MTLEDTTTSFRNALTNAGFTLGPVKTIQYGIQFTVSKLSFLKTIRIYSSKKKGITIDLSQIGDGPVADQIKSIEWQLKPTDEPVIPVPSPSTEESVDETSYPLIGADEAGKGDYFGQLTTAAVYVPDAETASALRAIGVRDCKDLNDEQVKIVAHKIEETLSLKNYYVHTMPVWSYNKKYNELKNLNVLLAWFHGFTIERLLDKVIGSLQSNERIEAARNTTLLVDQFSRNENTLKENLSEYSSQCRLIQRTTAESNVAVAAASIMARARFLDELEALSRTYEMTFPKGATHVIPAAREFVQKYGADQLSEVAKIHFKTTQQVLALEGVLTT